jgi:hypothetical protein
MDGLPVKKTTAELDAKNVRNRGRYKILADMDQAAIDIANALVRLSELTIFELRGGGGGFIGCRRRCGSPATS